MKKTLVSSLLILTLVGCATSRHQVAQTATDGSKTVTTDSTKQSDNAALSFLSTTVKVGGDLVSAILPPFIPVIVGGLTHPVTTPANASTP